VTVGVAKSQSFLWGLPLHASASAACVLLLVLLITWTDLGST